MGGSGEQNAAAGNPDCTEKSGTRAAGNPLFGGRRFAWTVNCHFFWYHEFQYPDVWCIWCMFNDGRVSGDWSNAR